MAAVVQLKQKREATLGDIFLRYLAEVGQMKDLGPTIGYILKRLAASEIGKVYASRYLPSHIVEHCAMRQAEGACPATIMQDVSAMATPLKHARIAWDMKDILLEPLKDAKQLLSHMQVISKSKPRDRRPTKQESALMLDFFKVQDQDGRTVIPMAEIFEFQLYSARRISETCRLKCIDVNVKDRTCIVRDMKDPRQKKGNDHEFPLLGRAWEIVEPRLQAWDQKDPDARIFPYNSKSISARFYETKKTLGIVGLRLHDLRRECASRLFEAGYSVPEVMLVTGHKTPNMLLRTYTALKAKDLHGGPASKRT
jgi:integrase